MIFIKFLGILLYSMEVRFDIWRIFFHTRKCLNPYPILNTCGLPVPHNEDATQIAEILILVLIPVQLFMSSWQKTNEIHPVE